jgi:DNA-binding transcriptional LysR family regulator
MIEGGLGIAVMPNYVCPASERIVKIPLDIAHTISYGIAWHENEQSEKVLRFVHITRAAYKRS